jgi:hypothetical protein
LVGDPFSFLFFAGEKVRLENPENLKKRAHLPERIRLNVSGWLRQRIAETA